MASKASEKQVRLKPQDPFDLIRLLARSQSDPRKAVAELVQNSLDAGSNRIEIVWFNEKGVRCLRITDDGRGVFPELEREAALERIARTIGHSHKRDLSPIERREQMVLGRYGIGLIGFWSVGEAMVIRSRVQGGKAWMLKLIEDRPTAQMSQARARVDDEETFTEITIFGLHPASVPKIRPPRLQAYLASELRGQLLERDATVTIRDRSARGRARKQFTVKPQPYLGLPLEQWTALEVEGYEDARVELYLVGAEEGRQGRVMLACGGTTVLDDLGLIDGDDAPRAPWNSGRLEGVIDFPDFSVAPSTRRGLVLDEPLDAFLLALPRLESELAARLASESKRRALERHENLAKDIRKVFRGVVQRLPEYVWFDVRASGDAARSSQAGADSAGLGSPADAGAELDTQPETLPQPLPQPLPQTLPDVQNLQPRPTETDFERDPVDAANHDDSGPAASSGILYPPGPLASIRVEPNRLRLPWNAERSLRARALDADGRACAGEVTWTWQLEGLGELDSDRQSATYAAPQDPQLPSIRTTIRVRAKQRLAASELFAVAEIPVSFTTPRSTPEASSGIPDPVPIHAPSETWRSRMRGNVWEFNEAHADYQTSSSSEARRLRYLVHLFAKEVVLRNFGNPGDDEVLERLIEVLTCLDGERRG